jgi:RecA-family ATPase
MKRLGEGCIEQLTAALEENPDLRLIVIDTLQRVMTTGKNQGKYGADYDAIGPLRKLAHRHNMTIALVHHTREAEAQDWTDMVAGSRGYIANVDAVMVAKRGRGSADVVIRVTGNDFAEAEHAFNAQSLEWELLGNATIAQLTDSRRNVMESVEDTGRSTPKEIAEATGISHGNVRKLVRRLTDDSLLRNYGDGTYGLYQLTERST